MFLDDVWPRIKHKCGGGNIRPIEVIEDNDLVSELDILCGLDIWQTIDGLGARGIASRVQNNNNEQYRGHSYWRTFTIRYSRDSGAETEYSKRMKAIKNGSFIYPYLTCQAYFDYGQFLGCAVARTVDIFEAINPKTTPIKRASNASFFILSFDEVPNAREFLPSQVEGMVGGDG